MIKKIDQIRINPYWLTMIVFVVSPLLFYAQMQRLPIHHLTIDDGLSQSSNDFIYRDSFGFVWLSSLDGLNRFDGKTIKVYKSILGDSTSLLGNIITSNFFEDKNSNLWFTTYEGLHCYIRKEDHFLRFQLNNEHQQTQKQ
ncbi:MAG: two-component regulator propeller domain-containing protein, partial [Bacteroidota bacterium]